LVEDILQFVIAAVGAAVVTFAVVWIVIRTIGPPQPPGAAPR
jgi:hypothetical protein